jgi:hypothetical protein
VNSTIEQLFERFSKFEDGLLQAVSLVYDDSGERHLEVVLRARDWQSKVDAWATIRLRLRRVESFSFQEDNRTTMQVLSNGLHLLVLGERVAVEFGTLVDPPQSLQEISQSPHHAIALEIDASLEELSNPPGAESAKVNA